MGKTDYLLGEIRKQRRKLERMISMLERKERFESGDSLICERLCRAVEKNLRQLMQDAEADYFLSNLTYRMESDSIDPGPGSLSGRFATRP